MVTGPVVLILPTRRHTDTLAAVVNTLAGAVAAVPPGGGQVVAVDCDPASDAAQWAWAGPVQVIPRRGRSWGGAVHDGVRVARALQARAVVLADPACPAELSTDVLACAAGGLEGPVHTVWVARPAPWWQRLPAIHLLRPLLAPVLAFTVADPWSSTLALTPAAAQRLLADPRDWAGLDWEQGCGLALIAVLRRHGLGIAQLCPPPGDYPPGHGCGALIEERDRALLPPTLRLLGPRTTHSPAPAAPWCRDLDMGTAPRRDEIATALTYCRTTSPRPGTAANWPHPLIELLDRARRPDAYSAALSQRAWELYLQRLAAWLPQIHAPDPSRAHRSAQDAAAAFRTATHTRGEDPA